MSHSKQPTLPYVLPMYEHMQKHLKNAINDATLLPKLRAASKAGLSKLDVYHVRARECQYNVISTLLHPSFGISWFRKVEPTGVRAQNANVLFRHAFDGYKAAEPIPELASRLPTDSSSSFLHDICMADVPDSLPDDGTVHPMADIHTSEVDRFFQADRLFGKGDPQRPLQWWKTHERDFPIIAKMARDFLAIPGTSVAVERLFSSARHICTELRSSLKAETIAESLLAKHWIKVGIFDILLRSGGL